MPSTHGWALLDAERKAEIIAAIRSGSATRGPAHIELDLTDRCNVACYFCNQQDLRTKESIPLAKLTALVDELQQTGLKSVRLSGGGDPLFHRDILPFLDHLGARGIVVDNVTTNGVALTDAVAQRLVRGRAREVVFSLNAADPADYARMMHVKPQLFDTVRANIAHLAEVRGEGQYPFITVQFLLDRGNATRLADMYDAVATLGVDKIAISSVLEIPHERVERDRLLGPDDRALVEPHLEALLLRDREAGLLDVDFAVAGWSEMVWNLRKRLGIMPRHVLAAAPSFNDHNGGCFFGWYTAAVTGNGDIRACCFMLNPTIKPLGNVHETATFAEQWHGPAFTRMREEMREVLIAGSDAHYSPEQHQVLQPFCVESMRCWLKNMYFRGDEAFYRDLGKALDEMRTPTRFARTKQRLDRMVAARPRVRAAYDAARNASRSARVFLKKRFGWNLTDAC